MTRTGRIVLAAWLVAGGLAVPRLLAAPAAPADCPPGYERIDPDRPEPTALRGLRAADARLPQTGCVSVKRPEGFAELALRSAQQVARTAAPFDSVPPGAYRAAVEEVRAMPRVGGAWTPYGQGPLISGEEDYPDVAGLGLVELNGRVTDLEHVPGTSTLFATVANGGVWRSDNLGRSWSSIGESLPTQVVSSVAFTPANGGTLVVITGDDAFGAYSFTGLGVFHSLDGGANWLPSPGVPSDAFGFSAAVDPTNPNVVYAATGTGLFRSADGGRSFVNVALPTGPCAGKPHTAPGCLLANMVTDVVVQSPGGVGDATGGKVVAAVGWRGGNRTNPDGTTQSPGNGIYLSDTGEPGSFTRSPETGFVPQDQIGRIELGLAEGPAQDHDYLYAIVQDAILFRDLNGTIDAPEVTLPVPVPGIPTVLNGVYVSSDLGRTWTLMATGLDLQSPATGSAMTGPAQISGFGPGVQGWYNLWIAPDPTRQTADGVPTRLVFGLEELWQNEVTALPQNGRSLFKVIGRYFAGRTCLFLDNPLPVCPTNREDALSTGTTTHPDQHAGVFVPDATGGVTLVVANDGGVYTQTVDPDGEFSNDGWGIGANRGFNTLEPYAIATAADGITWMGLQDNGTAKITGPGGRQLQTFGGDGFFVAVDPANSDIAYGETSFADMRVTTDGGKTWRDMPPPITNAQFNHPFAMDPRNPAHLLTAGREVVETTAGSQTGATPGLSLLDPILDLVRGGPPAEPGANGWVQVYDLGTANRPGDSAAPLDDLNDPSNQMSAVALDGAAAYVGFCGVCDVLNSPHPFRNGIATNVGEGGGGGAASAGGRGSEGGGGGAAGGWHIASADGLPNRYITSIAIDPADPRTITVTLSGYTRRWTPPGALDEATDIGDGHVYRSTDAGQTFTDISGNLPDIPASWIEQRGGQLIVGTDLGVFLSSDLQGGRWSLLGDGLPFSPVLMLEQAPGDESLLLAATYGRGVWAYGFPP